MKAFPVITRILRAAWDELFLSVVVSLLWWAGALLVVTAGPATLGLNAVASRLANYRRSGTEFFWEEAKAYPGRAWALLAIILLGSGLLLFNVQFYAAGEGWMDTIALAWIWVFLLFLLTAQYFFPLFCRQDERKVRLTLRNAALLALRSPLYSLIALLWQLFLVILCVALVLPALLLLPALLAISANFFLTGLLQEIGLADPPPVLPPGGD